MAEQDAFAKLSRSIGPAFNRAAPDAIRWATEAAHFERQIRECKAKIGDAYHYVLREGIENGVEETIQSCRAAARQIAAMGLSANPIAKLVYFIPRRARERAQGEPWSEYAKVPWLVDATPSYMGLAYIATHYAGARVFGACEVYKADVFVNNGPFKLPTHQPTRDPAQREERLAEGAYAGVVLQGDYQRSEYIDAPTIQRIRGLSKIPGSMMYTTLWTEGWKKICVRRLCKLVMQGEERMLAAEEAQQRHEGFTFDEHGEVISDGAPRGTSAAEPATARPTGLDGLRTAMQEATVADQETDAPRAVYGGLPALPAPSKNPEGSIEWWLEHVGAAKNGGELDAVKVAALQKHVDQGDDADTFRSAFTRRRRELRQAGALDAPQ